MTFSQRVDTYRAQTGRSVLTTRQARRLRHKAYRAGKRILANGGAR